MSRIAHNHLKSSTSHDEQLLATMTHMVASHPNAKITMASFNVINIEGDGLGEFLQELVNQVPVLDMKVYKVKQSAPRQTKHKVVDNGLEKHCIHFNFYRLDYRRRLNIPPSEEVNIR